MPHGKRSGGVEMQGPGSPVPNHQTICHFPGLLHGRARTQICAFRAHASGAEFHRQLSRPAHQCLVAANPAVPKSPSEGYQSRVRRHLPPPLVPLPVPARSRSTPRARVRWTAVTNDATMSPPSWCGSLVSHYGCFQKTVWAERRPTVTTSIRILPPCPRCQAALERGPTGDLSAHAGA